MRKAELKSELEKQSGYQFLVVTDIELSSCLNWITGTAKINGSTIQLEKLHTMESIEDYVTRFLSFLPNSVFNPIPRFKMIRGGICPDCNGCLDGTGRCMECFIKPSLDPDFQVWIKESKAKQK